MQLLLILLVLGVLIVALVRWYQYEVIVDGEATVHLQSEHEHFHLHVDLPEHMTVEPGDTLHILNIPPLENGRTREGEMSYQSPVRLHKASWLSRYLTKSSSIVEVSELVDHP